MSQCCGGGQRGIGKDLDEDFTLRMFLDDQDSASIL